MYEDAGIRLANIAAYGVLVNKNEAKQDNTCKATVVLLQYPLRGWTIFPAALNIGC